MLFIRVFSDWYFDQPFTVRMFNALPALAGAALLLREFI